MAVWSIVEASTLNKYSGRIDAEYFRPETLNAELMVTERAYKKFGSLVTDGYRVVYENTKILRSDRITTNDCRFLQATNISQDGLSLSVDEIGFVSENDWNRYPKGRISRGEILIEVKGQAEKVAIVPDDFPERTLVSGSVFKATISSEVSPEFIFSFFNCYYGKLLRDRSKTNTLIAFVSKPELYKIPIPIPSNEIHSKVTCDIKEAIRLNILSKSIYTQAQQLFEKELGLDQLLLDKSKNYATSFSEVMNSRRIDSQCYKPDHIEYEKYLRKKGNFNLLRELVFQFVKGKQKKTATNGNIHYASIKDIQGFEIFSGEKCLATPDTAIADSETLLLAITGATIGKIGIVSRSEKLAFSGDLLAFKLNSKINPYYLLSVMLSHVGQSQCHRWITGSTNGHLSPLDVSKFVIPRVDTSIEEKIANLLVDSIIAKKESEQLLEQAKCQVEELIEGNVTNG